MGNELIIRIKTAIIFILILFLSLIAVDSNIIYLKIPAFTLFLGLSLILLYETAKIINLSISEKKSGFFIIASFLVPLAFLIYPRIFHPDISNINSAIFLLFGNLVSGFLCVFIIFLNSRFKFTSILENFRIILPAFLHICIGVSSFIYLLIIEDSFFIILWILLVVTATDSIAYFVGKSFGKSPLAPVISPKKTIEGSIAGLIAGALTGFIAFSLLDDSLPVYCIALFCIIVPISAMLGDLNASYLKRIALVKDSGRILPGHGGVLDRADATLACTVWLVFFVLFQGM